jgi:hypothetical protein
MLNLTEIRAALEQQWAKAGPAPCHIAGFSGWVTANAEIVDGAVTEALAFTGQARHPEHVAALGFGAATGQLSDEQLKILREEILHLGGRSFFSAGRPPRFEVDGSALLGVALGAARVLAPEERRWLVSLLERSSGEVASDTWQLGLVRMARLAIGERDLRIVPADLATAAVAKGLGDEHVEDREQAWRLAAELSPHDSGPGRDAARLAVFESELSRAGQLNLGFATRDDLIALLNSVSRGMKRWTFETKSRTPKSAVARWDVENEYHVQNLLWTVLAPVFPDLEDEENLPSIGQKHPRADLGLPSLRTIVEVKYIRHRGQPGFAKLIEEVAADTALYLSKTRDYDNIVAFVWDDCAQTEHHHELKSGLEQLRGVSAAIVLPRPSGMRRSG